MVMLLPEKEIKGPSHSSYSKVVVPSKETVVPSFRSVISRVSPAGTVIPLRTIVEQEPLEAAAASASVKVQPDEAETELGVELGSAAEAAETELLVSSNFPELEV
jgi:hypothetical protein